MQPDFISAYLSYTSNTEATAGFHRWSAIGGIAAWLERNCWLRHRNGRIYPNHYIMLLGRSGARKSQAIKDFSKLLKLAGYEHFAAAKTSKEKFLSDLAAKGREEEGDDSLLEENLFGPREDRSSDEITPVLVAADEANNFFGINNMEFLSILGELWDFEGIYENRLKTSKSDFIPNPTITILSGNTPTNFTAAFPPAIVGQGFFSRLLIIHGERTRPKITFPEESSPEATAALVVMLGQMKQVMMGEIVITSDGKDLLDKIYHLPDSLTHPQFQSYYERRLTHLFKLCLVVAASRLRPVIDYEIVLEANTWLTYAETLMPKALGEFGKAKDSDVVQKVYSIIDDSLLPISMKDIWKLVNKDLSDIKYLGDIIRNLAAADKIQSITGMGFTSKKEIMLPEDTNHPANQYVDFKRFLTIEELGVKL